ncbi:MAG TPA: PKD domain-containing protein [Thermoanaerobaculia bacterium]
MTMFRPSGPRVETLMHRSFALLLLPVLFLLALPAASQTTTCDRNGCGRLDCAAPARAVPQNLWGNLQPASTSLPSERDTTAFNEFKESYYNRNWFYGVDIENGYVLMGLAHGIGIWDARTDPANPAFVVAKRYLPGQAFPYLPAGEASKIVFGAIDAPAGVDSVAAVVGYNGSGMLIFDLKDKTQPRAAYQNTDKTSESVYAAMIGGTNYAFMASSYPGGLYIYNMDRAVASSSCFEDASTPAAAQCPGVLVNRVTPSSSPYFVHGAGNYVVISFGSGRGFEIYDVSNPSNPQLKLSGLRGTGGRSVQGVALWNQGSSYFLAARLDASASQGQQTAIYDVSCITGTCSGLSAPLTSLPLDTKSTSQYLTFSRSGNTPFLYVGGDHSCTGSDGEQREWLLDVSSPAAPEDITPKATMAVTGTYGGQTNVPKTVNYWSWYYRGSPTGFNLVSPRAGKFNGDYFYRAARSVFDVHKRAGSTPPAADFVWSPAEIYPDTPVTFTDRSSGAPVQWSWSFAGGNPTTSTSQTEQVTFGSAGSKAVSLTSINGVGRGSVTKNITVLDPTPQGSVASSPATQATRCEAVTFTANATGAPTLSYEWQVLGPDGLSVTGGPQAGGKTFGWASLPGHALGTYTGKVVVKNGHTPNGVPMTKTIQLVDLPALTNISGLQPSKTSQTSAKVDFQAPAHQGATKWVWSFGDGTVKEFTNATEGKNPSHTYAAKGTYNATVTISNCTNQQGFTSQPLAVEILEVKPLAAGFQGTLFCQFGTCFATAGKAIEFSHAGSSGAEVYEYDWNHTDASEATCNFTDVNHTSPVTSHTYTTAGTYRPCLRVKRGTEQKVAVHGAIVVEAAGGGGGGGGNNSPSISVSGPLSGQLNQSYTYTAFGSNCTPNTNGWTWNTSGGTVTGDVTGNSISVSWSTAGSKSVTVTNSSCGNASGQRNVTITDPNGGGGGGNPSGPLQAQFTFAPGLPKPGETVTFDASSSSGAPVNIAWDFGDSGKGSGLVATHAYANAGSYVVRLTITKQGSGPGCLFGTCVSELTKAVVVSGTPPPPPVSPEFSANAECLNIGAISQCQAQTGKAVTLTAEVADATSYQWSFGDNTTGSGRSVSHAWSQPGSYAVGLTVTKGGATSTKTRTFIVSGAPAPSAKSVVLPWIAQTRGALNQSSDLYVHNPGTTPMDVTLEFRKRGQPESNPPREPRTIAPGATLYVGDVLREFFDRENIAGFISVKVDKGDVEPVITSFNTTFQADGKQFGQTVSGVSMSRVGGAASATSEKRVQSLVGLANNGERLTYFGISNPSEESSTYHLRFYDKNGRLVGESTQDSTLSRFGQRQYQAKELTELFGITNLEDYRVEIETKAGGSVIPYASNLRLASEDPSFIEPGTARSSKVYLLGALSAPGLNNSVWQTDVLLSNTSAQELKANVTFTSVGLNSTPTTPLQITLAPGKTERLENVVADQWNIHNGIGVVTVTTTSPAGVFPVVQGESYENTNPAKRFGQAMTAFGETDAAGVGKRQFLVGLRQDATHRTTLWVFNPSSVRGVYDIVYRNLDGTVIGTASNVALGAGKMRQFSPGQHPLPAAGATNGFTIQIVVKEGQVLSAAQVINNATNDPAYIKGDVR